MYILIAVISVFSVLNEATTQCKYNYGFVIDESGSVGILNYYKSVDFVIDLIENNIHRSSPLMALSFDGNHRFVHHFDDEQTSRTGPGSIVAALEIEKAAYNGGGTATGQAMEGAIQEFKDESFTSNNIIMLITDGAGGNPCAVEIDLSTYDIRVIIVGVGGFNPTSNACLVRGNTNDIIKIADWNFQPVIDLLEQDQIVCTCDENGMDQPCQSHADCAQYGECMMCCRGTNKCHKKPEFTV